ncbi:MAG: hypothetical protein AMJ69_10625 [Gammaproteobacteria bacterium SG8_47]|nr:MAG: hypothetical protein AMJ69_10625 [Gammaproteobacteria bacterium SG8_47]
MRTFLYKLAAATVLVVSVVAGWLWMDYQDFLVTPLALPEEGAVYTVIPGTSLRQIADDLDELGVLSNPVYLMWYGRLTGQARRVQAGEYRIEAGATPVSLVADFVAGKVHQYTLTLVEGWTYQQVLEAVRGSEYLTQTLGAMTRETLLPALGYPEQHPEGMFFPDTYHFPRGTTDVSFLQRAYEAMQRHLAEQWENRSEGLPVQTAYEALVLASIIEKETAVPEERKAIAGVFVRRLQKGMRLQTDPTVIYGLGESFDGNLRRRDLRSDSPYNTYRIKGLPPTPIAMPSLAAIEAALHPAPGKALYFVARGDGSHEFSDTLEEHNEAVIKYQLGGKRRPFSSSK